MSNLDTLKIYDDLKASGIPEVEAHAQAMAIAHANRVTLEDMVKIREDFTAVIDKLILKMDINFSWLRGIGIGLFVAVIGNIIVNWAKL